MAENINMAQMAARDTSVLDKIHSVVRNMMYLPEEQERERVSEQLEKNAAKVYRAYNKGKGRKQRKIPVQIGPVDGWATMVNDIVTGPAPKKS